MMRAKIRGHYRIDADGRVISVVEKADSTLPYEPFRPLCRVTYSLRAPNFIELCLVVAIVAVLISAVLVIRPKIQRAIANANAARNAAIIQLRAQKTANSPSHK
jgi:hypothetical protein